MANVIFKFGTRAQYDALTAKGTHTLYWLTDTQELMKGDVCYGKGAAATAQAAGLLSAEDKAKLDELSAGGLLSLTATDASILISDADGGKSIGVQLSGADGNILKLKDDGLFAEVEAVPISKVTGLEDRLTAIEQAAVGGVHYKGSVDTVDDLPTDAAQGDLYEVTADNSEWCWNGEKWFEYGKTTNLSPIATAELNPSQLTIEDGVLKIVGVDSQLVGYRGKTLLDILDEMSKSLVWEELGTQVDLSTETAANVVAAAEDGDVINFSDGDVTAVTIDKSVTLRGATAGLAQNFAQEVEA